jgi:predicted dehydrogenase
VRVFDSGVMLPDPATFGQYALSYRTGSIVSPHVEPAEPLAVELADFCASIRSGGTPRSSAELGLEVVRMIEAVDESLLRTGARVPVGPGVPVLELAS